MASELPISEQIQRLVRESDTARGVIGSEIRNLKYKLDVPSRLKDSLRSHPSGWVGGSVVAGLAASLLFRKKSKPLPVKEEVKKKTLMGFFLTLGIAALRPLVKAWLTGQLKHYISAKFTDDEIHPRTQRRVNSFYQ